MSLIIYLTAAAYAVALLALIVVLSIEGVRRHRRRKDHASTPGL